LKGEKTGTGVDEEPRKMDLSVEFAKRGKKLQA